MFNYDISYCKLQNLVAIPGHIEKVVNSELFLLFFTRCIMSFKQPKGTFTQQAFCSITLITDDLSNGLLLSYQPHRLTCIDMGEIVVPGGDCLCKPLLRFIVLWERIDVGVPL